MTVKRWMSLSGKGASFVNMQFVQQGRRDQTKNMKCRIFGWKCPIDFILNLETVFHEWLFLGLGVQNTAKCLYACFTPDSLFDIQSPQWGAADTEIKVPSGENTELKRSPFKAWSRSAYAIHATLTFRDFFLAYFYPSGPFTCIFSKTSPDFSCVGCG